MKIKNGALQMNKTEVKNFLRMIRHSSIDMEYGPQGTFSIYKNGEYEFDSKEAERVKKAIKGLRWILSDAINL